MKASKPRNTAIDGRRLDEWLDHFHGYRVRVTRTRLEGWLQQFAATDRDTAARILDCVDYISQDDLTAACRALLARLPGWSVDPARRQGRWLFCPFSSSTGESGDTLLHTFRIANGLDRAPFRTLFASRAELLMRDPGPDDTVVFLDDIAGTGTQAADYWEDTLSELLPRRPRIILALVAALDKARTLIEEQTPFRVIESRALTSGDQLFSDDCREFDAMEKERILKYCRRADRRSPKGFGDCGLLVVFHHRCPNNSIPVLHSSSPRFPGLFPRY